MTPEERWARPAVNMRWVMTQWCNYRCWYCRQDHRRRQTYRGGPGHWADAATPAAWGDAFDRHFSGARLTLSDTTGGEPMLDLGSFRYLFDRLHDREYFVRARVDTNLWWDVRKFGRPYSRVHLMASYHPSETDEDEFFSRLAAVMDAGWTVPIVNFVTTPERVRTLERVSCRCEALGTRLNVLMAFTYAKQFIPNELAEVRRFVHPSDWANRSGEAANVTAGKPCLFPSASYEMEPDGSIKVGCREDLRGSFFDERLPERPVGYTPCPMDDCFCEDKYTFLQEVGTNTGVLPMDTLHDRIPLSTERVARGEPLAY